jgi:hypothetical protein
MITRIFIFAAMVLSVFIANGVAQSRHEWIGKVKETIKLEEPAWKIDGSIVNNDGAHYAESIRVKKGSYTGVVEITVYDILTNPEETFTGLVTVRDNLSRRQKKTRIEGLGDEAYMWAGSNADDYTSIYFKKDKTFVSIYLPGRTTAQRIAKHVGAKIP